MAEETTTAKTPETPLAKTNENRMRIPSINKIASATQEQPVHPADLMARALLGEKYEKIPRQLRRPKFLGGKHQYDHAALIRRLRYADSTLRNTNARLPPRLKRIMSAYRNALILLLDHRQYRALKQRNPEISRARYWNQILVIDEYGQKEKTCIATSPPKESSDQSELRLQDTILAYQRMAFWIRYGSACPESWAETSCEEWNSIAIAACRNKTAQENPTAPRDKHNEEIIKQVTNTCLRIGISRSVFLEDLVHFREEGVPQRPQRGLRYEFHGMQVSQAAFILHTDYSTAEFIVEYGADAELEALRRGIRKYVKLYFQQFDEKLEDWTSWIPYESVQNTGELRERQAQNNRDPELIKEKGCEESRANEEERNQTESPSPAEMVKKDWRAAFHRLQKKLEQKRAKTPLNNRPPTPILTHRPPTPILTQNPRAKFAEIQYRPWNSSHVVERSRYDFSDAYDCPALRNNLQSPPCYVFGDVEMERMEREHETRREARSVLQRIKRRARSIVRGRIEKGDAMERERGRREM